MQTEIKNRIFYVLFFIFSIINAQNGQITGIVEDSQGLVLQSANVVLLNTNFGTATDAKGLFSFNGIKAGDYTLKCSFIGYKSKIFKVKLLPKKTVFIRIKLESKTFKIGEIVVKNDENFNLNDASSIYNINSGEIEHFQATSLKDVLELVPGVQRSSNPGLDKTSEIAIRGNLDGSDNFAAFGTMIMIDGVVESNNANMQFERLTGRKFGGSNLRGSVDLREIPADNIESIEILSGVSSVRYGDFTSGIIKVNTKLGMQPNRIKAKANPGTAEINFAGSFNLLKDFSYNFNIARSQRDRRLDGDEYTRYTGQLAFKNNFFQNKLRTKNKFNFTAIYDEEEPKNVYAKTNNYNRGFSLGFLTKGKFSEPYSNSELSYNINFSGKKINSRKSRMVQSDLRVLPSGDTVSTYLGVVENKGMQWNLGARFEYKKLFFTGDFFHDVLAGLNFSYEGNTGEGIKIDTLFNYYGSDSPRRSYSYDDIPWQFYSSIYMEDKITGNLGLDFSLRLGLRYQMFNPRKINFGNLFTSGAFIDSYQGNYLMPRLNLHIFFDKNNVIKLSAGKNTKAPPLSNLYQPVEIVVWRNPVAKENVYYKINRDAPRLKAYTENLYEASYETILSEKVNFALTAYYKERSGGIASMDVPIFYKFDKKLEYIDSYGKQVNLGRNYTKGLEIKIKTKKIEPLNMNFVVSGTYLYVKSPGTGKYYDPYPDYSLGQKDTYVIGDTVMGRMVQASGKWSSKLQLNYAIKYKNPVLGIWATLRAEQLVFEDYQYFDLEPIDYNLLTPEGLLQRKFDEAKKRRPNKWLFSFTLSKSLFEGAEISFYANNFLDDPAYWDHYIRYDQKGITKRNPDIFYGIEFSMSIDKILR